jgi:putative PIG3 family NAD(P)H quinone oxidoreductase
VKAIVITRPGPPEVLQIAEHPKPQPGESEVLIRVHAAGINRADVLQREGRYPAPAHVSATIPGLEVAGVVEARGAAVQCWQEGDAVAALLAGGGYAEYVTVDAGHCLPVPRDWSFTDAAALPEALCTVWSNVIKRGRLQTGEKFLVHGGSSGIGLAAIQIARARGARVFATAGSAEKCRVCEQAGAERAINYRTDDFEVALKEEGVDVILDMVGGDYVAKNLRLLNLEGRLVFIAAMRGAEVAFDVLQVMTRRLTITGSTLRARDHTFKTALVAEVNREVGPLLANGKFSPHVFQTFPLAEAAAAHRRMESSSHIGKIVLTVA